MAKSIKLTADSLTIRGYRADEVHTIVEAWLPALKDLDHVDLQSDTEVADDDIPEFIEPVGMGFRPC